MILNENTLQIRNILNDINTIIDSSLTKSVEINKYEVFGIFNCILEKIELNDVANAYMNFIHAYGYSSNFDNVKNNKFKFSKFKNKFF